MWAFLNNSDKLRKWLFIYWLVSPFLFMGYALMMSQTASVDLREVLNEPTMAIAFLTSCMTLIMAGMLKGASSENEKTEKVFGIYAVVQQLLVGNLIGALLSYFFARSLWLAPTAPFAPRLKWVLLPGMVLIGFLSLMVILIAVNRVL
ncbi:cell shape determination protein CcmA [Rothia aerolata]|uniref:cell shape determination protein CcmA n=1 Tax=Rothia aerolata TaxID=1812262 RepID=UPI00166B7CE4|nr:cell shape determination protein CcmA [Rothia aerolata]